MKIKTFNEYIKASFELAFLEKELEDKNMDRDNIWKDVVIGFAIGSVIGIVLGLITTASAHPVDREDQAKLPHLNLDDPEFFELHGDYWHERRTLFAEVIPANALCYGAVNQLEDALKLPRTPIPPNLINYYSVVPAHPCEDYPEDLSVCRTQLEAAKATLSIQNAILGLCEGYRQYLYTKLLEKDAAVLSKEAAVLNKEAALRKACGSKCNKIK